MFAQAARIEIDDIELALLKKAAEQDWSNVRPEIFGTLFQYSMDDDERYAFGAHFTSASAIMKIVEPAIVKPCREQAEMGSRNGRENPALRDQAGAVTALAVGQDGAGPAVPGGLGKGLTACYQTNPSAKPPIRRIRLDQSSPNNSKCSPGYTP